MLTVDAAFFATADPETLLVTGAYAEEPLAAASSLFLDNEFARSDVNKFAGLASSKRHVASLDGATHRDRPSSDRYRDIMGPLGLGDELRAALVVGGKCWGYLCLHREDQALGFTASEAALVTRLGPHIADALRSAMLLQTTGPVGDMQGGVVLLAEDMSVVAMTPEAERLLSLVTVPLLLSAHGLTAREAEVARLVLRGTPTRAIADALHISRHTVQDHLKAVFDKFGVHSRRDFVGHLLSSAGSDRR